MQKQLGSDLNRAVEQRAKLVQVSTNLQEMNKTLQGRLEAVQLENKSQEKLVFDLKLALEAATKAKTDAEGVSAQHKKALEVASAQAEKERTQWAREQQLHRAQEQKLIQLVQQAERTPKPVPTEVLEELERLKTQLGGAMQTAQELESVKSALVGRESQVAALERKCLRYERELKLREDESAL